MAVRHEKSRRTLQIALLSAATVLAAVSGLADLARSVKTARPDVGDIIAFDPARPPSLADTPRVPARRPGKPACVLELAVILRSGGSLVVEQRGDATYRAHWAGPRTADGAADCGADAELVLTAEDMGRLAAAAAKSSSALASEAR